MIELDELYALIQKMVMCLSPSGMEGEIDAFLLSEFRRLKLDCSQDAAGNIIARIPGRGRGRVGITAHKDEIGMMVTKIEDGGRLRVRKLGGSFPWVYGEGVVDIIGSERTIQGVLSFGSRHVSHASPQFVHKETAPLKWSDVWIETKCNSAELIEAGVRPGARAVVGRHRRSPLRLGNYICSYTLDNKASLAVMLMLAADLRENVPEVWLIASAKEEVGATGALYLTQRNEFDALVALEVAPVASEYSLEAGSLPVLLSEDSHGLYDVELNERIRAAARAVGLDVQDQVLSGFGSDASICMKYGHAARAACLGFPTENTHGFEIADLEAIANCKRILERFCNTALALEGLC